MAEKRIIELEVKDNTQSLKAQLREAQSEVQKLADKYGATSKEAIEAAKRAADIKDRIGDAKALTDAFNPDAKFKALSASLSGVAGGFSAVTGAMGLLGVESQDVQQMMLKVQSAMALSQGLQSLGEAKDSFKQLGAVVNSAFAGMTSAGKAFAITGIGLAITAVGVLVTAFGNFGKKEVETYDQWREKQDKVNEATQKHLDLQFKQLENARKNVDKLTEQYDREIALARARGNSDLAEIKTKEKLNTIIKTEQENRKQYDEAVKKARAELNQQIGFSMQLEKHLAEYAEKSRLDDEYKGRARAIYNVGLKGEITINQKALEQAQMVLSYKSAVGKIEKKNLENAKRQIADYEHQTKLIENLKKLGAERNVIDKSIADAQNEINVMNAAANKAAAERNAELKRERDANNKDIKRQIEDEKNKRIENELERTKKELEINAQRRKEDLNKLKADETQKKLLKEEIDATLKLDLQKAEKDYNKKIDEIEEQKRKDKLEKEKELQEKIKENELKESERFLSDQEIVITLLNDGLEKQIAIRKLAYDKEQIDLQNKLDNQLITEEQFQALSRNNFKNYNKGVADDTKKIDEEMMQHKIAVQQQGLDLALQANNLMKDLFGKSKGVQKTAILVESAVGIAKMIISNKLANAGALATPQAIATSGAAAVPVIAMNNISTGLGIAANIAATAKALKEIGAGGAPPPAPSTSGGGGGGGGGSMSSGIVAPNFNVVGNNNINQLAQLQQQPIKAYVVGSEVTTQQSLDRNRIGIGQL